MSDHLRALCGEALKDNGKQFLELAKAQLATLQAEGRADLEERQKQITEAVGPVKESLSKVDTKLERLEQDRRRTQGALEAQLRSVADGQRQLHIETGGLVAALRQPQTRGRWGEMQLKRVVEMAGMLPHCDFIEQSQIEADGQVLRPDLIINLPGGKHVVVDAKAPLQAFLDAHQAQDEEQRQAHLRLHARQLREHIRKLSSKGYWAQFDSTPEFVFLFLPGEHFYNAALEAEPRLIEEGVNQCVIVATPMTLITLLRAVAYGWQQEKVAEDARAIAGLGRELHQRLSVYVDHMERLGRRLNNAVGAFNDAVGSLESRVLPGARRFAEHGAVSAGKELPMVEPIESTARATRAPELVERANGVGGAALPPASEKEESAGTERDAS